VLDEVEGAGGSKGLRGDGVELGGELDLREGDGGIGLPFSSWG